jgi:hypothetical protein
MADKKKLPGHKWRLDSLVVRSGINRYLYRCSACNGKVLDGEPFPQNLEKCEKR